MSEREAQLNQAPDGTLLYIAPAKRFFEKQDGLWLEVTKLDRWGKSYPAVIFSETAPVYKFEKTVFTDPKTGSTVVIGPPVEDVGRGDGYKRAQVWVDPERDGQ